MGEYILSALKLPLGKNRKHRPATSGAHYIQCIAEQEGQDLASLVHKNVLRQVDLPDS